MLYNSYINSYCINLITQILQVSEKEILGRVNSGPCDFHYNDHLERLPLVSYSASSVATAVKLWTSLHQHLYAILSYFNIILSYGIGGRESEYLIEIYALAMEQ